MILSISWVPGTRLTESLALFQTIISLVLFCEMSFIPIARLLTLKGLAAPFFMKETSVIVFFQDNTLPWCPCLHSKRIYMYFIRHMNNTTLLISSSQGALETSRTEIPQLGLTKPSAIEACTISILSSIVKTICRVVNSKLKNKCLRIGSFC